MAGSPWFIVATCCQNGSLSLPGLSYMGWMGNVGIMALVWFQISRGNRDCWELSHNNNGSDREASTVAIFTLQLHRCNFTLLTQAGGYCVRTYTSFPRRQGRQQQALLNSGIAKKGGADQRQDFLGGLSLNPQSDNSCVLSSTLASHTILENPPACPNWGNTANVKPNFCNARTLEFLLTPFRETCP